MITYKFFGNEQKIIYEKMNNGLDVFVIPNNKIKYYHVQYVVKYGSCDDNFKPINEKRYVKVPLGTAHFLEHKMFEMEDSDPFEVFESSGTFSNASTSNTNTKYYINGKKSFEKNLDYLTTMVFTTNFSLENVIKEQGIISEEIKMYNDQPEWILYEKAKNCLMNSSFQNSIGGSSDTIKKITPKLLTQLFETFYQPSNMFLVVSGNVSFSKVMKVLMENEALNRKQTNCPVISKRNKETKEVPKEYEEAYANIITPKFEYSFKIDINNFTLKDKLLIKMYLNMIVTSFFGEGSDFEDNIIKNKIANYFHSEHLLCDDIYIFSLVGESEFIDLFVEKVNNVLEKKDILLDDFIRIRKIWISIILRSMDSPINMTDFITDDLLEDEKIIDYQELIEKLNYNELLKVLKEISFCHKSLILLLPKDK